MSVWLWGRNYPLWEARPNNAPAGTWRSLRGTLAALAAPIAVVIARRLRNFILRIEMVLGKQRWVCRISDVSMEEKG